MGGVRGRAFPMQISGPHTEAPALTLLGQASEFVFVPQDSITSVDTTLVDRKQDRNLEPSMFLPLVYETFPITLSKLYQQTSKKRKTVFPNLCAMTCSLTVHYQIRTLHCIFTLLRVSAHSFIKGSEKSCSKHICHLHFIQGSPHVFDYKAFLPLLS